LIQYINLGGRDWLKMLGKPQKYISLKEAARISGYSSDYIGWLIRKGKIKGKKVYLNTSWEVLELEIIKYCRANKQVCFSNKQVCFSNKAFSGKPRSFFGKKYLSLKEAAKLSGYAPDYIGQLIRNNKVKGKRIYSGIAWLIDEKVLQKYLKNLAKNSVTNPELLKKKQRQKAIESIGLIQDIFPPELLLNAAREITGWKPYENKTAKIFGIGWRFSLAAFVFLLLVGVGPVEVFHKIVEAFSVEEKQIANFYPTNCYGGWENSQSAQGQPEDGKELNETNSAVLRNSIAPIFCEDFAGEIPEDAEIKKVSLKFSWALKEEMAEFVIPASGTDSAGAETPTNETLVPADTPDVNSEGSNIEESVPAPESIPEAEPAPAPSSFFRKIINSVFAQEEAETIENSEANTEEENLSESEEIPIDEEVKSETETGVSPRIDLDSEQNDTENITEEIDEQKEEEILPEETSEEAVVPSESEQGGGDSSGAFLEILFTLDGEKWQGLGKVGRDNWQNFSLEIPVSDWDEVENLQIKIDGLMTFDDQPVIYLDNLWLEVEYEELLEETKLTQEEIARLPRVKIEKEIFFKTSKEDFQLNEKPEFEVNTSYLEAEYVKTQEPELIPSTRLIPVPEEAITSATTLPFDQESIKEKLTPEKEEEEDSVSKPEVSQEEELQEEEPQEEPVITPESQDNPQIPEENIDNNPQEIQENDASSSFFNVLKNLFGFNKAIAKTSKTKILNVKILDPTGTEVPDLYNLKRTKDGIIIKINKPVNDFRPGKYKILVDVLSGENIFYSEQEFTWGVLAINIDRSIELPGNDAYLQFGVLDDKGYTICNADLDLSIQSPSGQTFEFTTKDGTIVKEEQCGPNNFIPTPDYYAHFSVPEELGVYSMTLTGHTDNGDHTINDNFEVRQGVEFDVVRSGPTRINPSYQYPATLEITPEADWQGIITETVPASFDIAPPIHNIPYDRVEIIGEEKIISWNLSLQAGEKSTIGYYFDAPDISPEFYLLGPLRFIDIESRQTLFEETRRWQIASDAVCTSKAGGGGLWNNAASWGGCARVPTTADTVVISTAQAITIDSAPNSVISVTINSGATLNGGSATLNINNTAASGTSFTNNGGTWNSGTGTVNFGSVASITVLGGTGTFTGSNKFNNITMTFATSVARIYTMGAAVDIGGNWTMTPTGGANGDNLTVDLGGATTVTGTTTLAGTGCTTSDSTSNLTTLNTNGQSFSAGYIDIKDYGETCVLNIGNDTLTLTGTSGTLLLRSSTGQGAGDFTVGGSSTTVVTSASGTPTILDTATIFDNLTINAGATIINAGANVTTGASDKLYIQAGVFNQEGRTITPGSSGTLEIGATGILCLGGTTGSTTADCLSGAAQTTTQSMPAYSTYTFDDASTVRYLSDAATTVDSTPTYGNLELKPRFVTTDRIYTFEGAVTIDGDFTINPDESGASTPRLTVNPAGKITLSNAAKTTNITATNSALSTLDLDPGTDYDLETGLLVIGSGGTLDASSSASVITLKGTSSTLFTRNGTFTQGQSDVQVTSGSGTPRLISVATTFHKLTINSNATVINMAAGVTINNASGAQLYVQAGVFNASGADITGPGSGNGTLQIGATGTLCLGGTANSTSATCNNAVSDTTTRSMPTFQTYTFDDASTVIYLSDADTAISSTPTYGNLYLYPVLISTNRTYTFGGAVTIDGEFTINPDESGGSTPSLTVNPAGKITLSDATKATTITATNSATSVLDLDPGADYDLETGRLAVTTGGTLDATSSASVITLKGTAGILFTLSGTFNQGTSDVQVTSGSGTPILLLSSATFHKLTINSNATVVNMGFAGVTINNAAGAQLYVQSGVFNASGADITGPGSGNGTLQIDNGATLCLGGTAVSANATCNDGASDTTARSMPTFQTYTFGTTSTVSYLSDAATSVSNTPTYGNLTLNPVFVTTSRIYTLGGVMTIDGNFEINPDESGGSTPALTVNAGGDITVASGKTTTITRTNSATATLDLDPGSDYNLTTGALTIQTGGTLDATSSISAINVAGAYTNNGTFTAGNSTVTLNGSSPQSLSGTMTGSSAFYNLIITNNSGASASDCELTDFDASVSFGASAEITNNYTITTSNVRVQYTDTATYTINNFEWEGTAGNLIYFRNSVAGSGQWLLNVSGTQVGLDYVDVSRSDADGGNQIDPLSGTGNFDCGNNDNWNFFTPSISFSLSANILNLGNLNTSSVNTSSHTATVTTNAPDGYILYVSDDGDLRKGSDTINNVGDGQVNANNEEYGLATSDSGQQITQDTDCPNSPYNASGITTGMQTAASSAVAVPGGETTTLCYAAAVSSSTINGYYSHIVTYVVTGRF